MLMNPTGAKQGLIPIPAPMPIQAPMPLPAASPIQPPLPIQPAGVLPPLMGTATVPTVPLAALARPLVVGEPVPGPRPGQMSVTGQRPQGAPPPRRRRTTLRMMGLPRPREFWRGAHNVPTNLPRPEDYWQGTRTTSQIYLPTPEEFWGK